MICHIVCRLLKGPKEQLQGADSPDGPTNAPQSNRTRARILSRCPDACPQGTGWLWDADAPVIPRPFAAVPIVPIVFFKRGRRLDYRVCEYVPAHIFAVHSIAISRFFKMFEFPIGTRPVRDNRDFPIRNQAVSVHEQLGGFGTLG